MGDSFTVNVKKNNNNANIYLKSSAVNKSILLPFIGQ